MTQLVLLAQYDDSCLMADNIFYDQFSFFRPVGVGDKIHMGDCFNTTLALCGPLESAKQLHFMTKLEKALDRRARRPDIYVDIDLDKMVREVKFSEDVSGYLLIGMERYWIQGNRIEPLSTIGSKIIVRTDGQFSELTYNICQKAVDNHKSNRLDDDLIKQVQSNLELVYGLGIDPDYKMEVVTHRAPRRFSCISHE